MKKGKKTRCYLREVCDNKNISLYKVAHAVGMHPNQMYTYTNKGINPSIWLALTIADYLNVSINDLWKLE